MVDISEYKVGIVRSVEENAKKGGKTLKICNVDVGLDEPVCIVTNAPNVREGSRVVVALAGSTVLTDEGEEIEVAKTSVGGTMSDGMMCDSKMLGWTGGAAGVAVQVPDDFDIGSSPPATKPRPKGSQGDSNSETPVAPAGEGLYEKKLTKEEKKKLAAEKRAAKKAAKEAAAKS